MPTEGELRYYDAIGETHARHACDKPYADPDCAFVLMQIGAVFAALPPPPARVLECGCGTGWLSRLLARRGYECVGMDVAPKAIEWARASAGTGPEPAFLVGNAETMEFQGDFDAVIFFDSLHHALDEAAALRNSYRALKPGGVCITSEPGNGHHAASKDIIEVYGVTEKDMPARHISRLGKEAGFQHVAVYPRLDDIGRYFFHPQTANAGRRAAWLISPWVIRLVNFVRYMLGVRRKLDNGLVVLTK